MREVFMNILTSAASTHLKWNLQSSTAKYQKSMELMSTGSKFTECSDDVISYAKAVKLDSKISQYGVISNNIDMGQNVLSIASASQENVLNNINKIKDLCMQAANGTYSDDEKNNILTEIRSRLEYVDYVAATTNFNGKKLLDGTCTYLPLQIADKQTIDISAAMLDVHAVALGIDLDPAITGENWTQDEIAAYMRNLDDASLVVVNSITQAGAYSMSLDNAAVRVDELSANYTELKSVYKDIDYAEITSDIVKNQLLQEFSVNVLVQYNQLASSTFSMLNPYQ